MKVIAALFVAFATLALAACKDMPAPTAGYAVHDGGNRHGSP